MRCQIIGVQLKLPPTTPWYWVGMQPQLRQKVLLDYPNSMCQSSIDNSESIKSLR